MPLDRTRTSTFAAYPKPMILRSASGHPESFPPARSAERRRRRGSSYRSKLRSGTIRNEDSSSKLRRTKVSFRGLSAGP